jgi:hypothetical protein
MPSPRDDHSPKSQPVTTLHDGNCLRADFNPYDALESAPGSEVKVDNGSTVIPDPLVGGSLPSHCSRDEKEKLTLALNTLVDFFALYGFRREKFNRESTLAHWQLCSVECGWMKFLKYKISAFFSDFLQTEIPPCPFSHPDHPRHLAGSTLGRYITIMMKNDVALEIATSVLYLKKGFPRPDEQQLAKALIATKKVLTTPRPVPDSQVTTPDGTVLGLAAMCDQVRRTCREVFGRFKITDQDIHRPYAPSIRANYVDARSKFGTFGTLMELGLIKDRADGRYLGDAFVETKEERIEEEDVVRSEVSQVFKDRVKLIYTECYETARQLAKDEEANVKLVALPESLKIRVISKGPPLTYFVLKPVQKFLHRIMRQHPVFELLGKTATPALLNQRFRSVAGQFHSLDYSSATDFLNPSISECAVSEICASVGMPDDLTNLFHKALVGHLVEGEPQVWGQLMGSIVSFPILCVVNAAVVRFAMEISEERHIPLSECTAVINGDDGAVRSKPSFLPIWKDCASLCGLEPSQGKVYSSDTYLNINSTSFTLNPSTGLLEHVPYVNMGLLTGMKRAGVQRTGIKDLFDSPEYQFSSLGAKHHQMMESCPRSLRLAVHRQFVHENWKVLSSTSLPWFVPELYGGVGLRPFTVEHYGGGDVDEFSRHYLESSEGTRYGPSDLDQDGVEILKMRKQVIPVKRIDTTQPIQVRSVWYRRSAFREQGRDPGGWFDHEMSDDDIGFMDVATYYLLPSLVAKEVVSNAGTILRHNERAWARLTRTLTASVGVVEELRESLAFTSTGTVVNSSVAPAAPGDESLLARTSVFDMV